MRCVGWKVDPGPCPVDDTPHTACTPASVSTRQIVVTTVRRPRVLDRMAGPPPSVEDLPVTPPAPEVKTFTQATYKRAVQGPKRKTKP